MQALGTENEQPGLLHTACLTDTKLSYSSHKIILIGLSWKAAVLMLMGTDRSQVTHSGVMLRPRPYNRLLPNYLNA